MRFPAFVLLLMLISATMLGLTQLFGSMHPTALAALFTNPDGTSCKLPCLFGIRPGETNVANALAMLDAHPLARELDVWCKDRQHVRSRQPRRDAPIIVIEVTADDIVDAILLVDDNIPYQNSFPSLHSNPDSLPAAASIGDAVAILGTPNIAGFSSYGYRYNWFNGQDLDVLILSEIPLFSQRLNARSPLYEVEIGLLPKCSPSNAPYRELWRPWIGFTSIQRSIKSPSVNFYPRRYGSGFYSGFCQGPSITGSGEMSGQ
jgi:hypothetical protein